MKLWWTRRRPPALHEVEKDNRRANRALQDFETRLEIMRKRVEVITHK